LIVESDCHGATIGRDVRGYMPFRDTFASHTGVYLVFDYFLQGLVGVPVVWKREQTGSRGLVAELDINSARHRGYE
jgi:hypothetical protein